MRAYALLQAMQEAAAQHAEQLGFGRTHLAEIGGYWVLTNLRMQFAAPLRCGDRVTIRTWPSGHNRLLATREFAGLDGDGKELFGAGSQWMILSRESARPQNLTRLKLDSLATGPDTYSAGMERLEPAEDYDAGDRLRVPYSSIDLNGHVNYTEYVRWGLDALRRAYHTAGEPRLLRATFLAEVFEDDELELQVARQPQRLLVRAQRLSDASGVFLMETLF